MKVSRGRKTLGVILTVYAIFMLTSCKTVEQVAVPTGQHAIDRDANRTEYVYDTVIIDRLREIVRKGDTVYIHDTTRIRDILRESKIDSVRVLQTDTIYVSHEVPVPVTEHGFLWSSGIVLWGLVALFVLALIIKFVIL